MKPKFIFAVLLCFSAAFLLSSCGYQGPLFLPKNTLKNTYGNSHTTSFMVAKL